MKNNVFESLPRLDEEATAEHAKQEPKPLVKDKIKNQIKFPHLLNKNVEHMSKPFCYDETQSTPKNLFPAYFKSANSKTEHGYDAYARKPRKKHTTTENDGGSSPLRNEPNVKRKLKCRRQVDEPLHESKDGKESNKVEPVERFESGDNANRRHRKRHSKKHFQGPEHLSAEDHDKSDAKDLLIDASASSYHHISLKTSSSQTVETSVSSKATKLATSSALAKSDKNSARKKEMQQEQENCKNTGSNLHSKPHIGVIPLKIAPSKLSQVVAKQSRAIITKKVPKLKPVRSPGCSSSQQTSRCSQKQAATSSRPSTEQWSQKSTGQKEILRQSKSSISHRKVLRPTQHVLVLNNERECARYQQIVSVYLDEKWHRARKQKFFAMLERFQLKSKIEQLSRSRVRARELYRAILRQNEQLRHVREKHFVEKQKRIANQHVKWKFIIENSDDRTKFGLPNKLKDPAIVLNKNFQPVEMTDKRKHREYSRNELRRRNQSRFELMFDSTTGKRYITAVPRA